VVVAGMVDRIKIIMRLCNDNSVGRIHVPLVRLGWTTILALISLLTGHVVVQIVPIYKFESNLDLLFYPHQRSWKDNS
jgi:hypothetical protein